MSSRLSGAILALAAATLLAISIVGSAWWDGHPVSPTRTYTQIAHVGLHGARLCLVDGADLETCKDAPTHSVFGPIGYAELVACGLLVISALGVGILTLRRSEDRKTFALLAIGGALLADALALGLVVIGPTSEATIPYGHGLYLFFIGSTLAIVGAVLARRPFPAFVLAPARQPIAVAFPAPVPMPLSQQQPVQPPPTVEPPPPVQPPPPPPPVLPRPPLAPPPSPGGSLAGPAGPLGAPAHAESFRAPFPPAPKFPPRAPLPQRAQPVSRPAPFSRPLPAPKSTTQPPPIARSAPTAPPPLEAPTPPPVVNDATDQTGFEATLTHTVGDSTDVSVPIDPTPPPPASPSPDASAPATEEVPLRRGETHDDNAETVAREKVSLAEIEGPTTPAPPKIPITTASESLPPPVEQKRAQTSSPSPACPQCEAPMAWVEEHLRFYCKGCRMYF